MFKKSSRRPARFVEVQNTNGIVVNKITEVNGNWADLDPAEIFEGLDEHYYEGYAKVRRILSPTDNFLSESVMKYVLKKYVGEKTYITADESAYRIPRAKISGAEDSLKLITDNEAQLLMDFEVFEGIELDSKEFIGTNARFYVSQKCIDFLEDIKKPHTAKVITDEATDEGPFYFVIAGEVYYSHYDNYWMFVSETSRVTYPWMLSDAAPLSDIRKRAKELAKEAESGTSQQKTEEVSRV